jgi:D-amino peptidase
MTGEVNAAVDGAFAAGATKVKIAEGHNAIDIRLLDERATLVPAYYPAAPPLQGWEGFDALVEVGKHAMAGTPDGMLAHTGNKSVEFVEINGIRVGESGTEAMEAGDYGFPMVMIAGDHAACREMQDLLGDIEVACVKLGYGPHHGECLPPLRARKLIREKTRLALKRLGDFRPYKVPGPVEYVQRLYQPHSENALQAFEQNPFASIIDDRTVCFKGRNVVEAFARRCGLIDYVWPGA